MNEEEIYEREQRLLKKTQELDEIEKEIAERQKKIKQQETARKQIVLRISPSLWNDISQWAEQDFRSINGQIEYILTEAVKKRKK